MSSNVDLRLQSGNSGSIKAFPLSKNVQPIPMSGTTNSISSYKNNARKNKHKARADMSVKYLQKQHFIQAK